MQKYRTTVFIAILSIGFDRDRRDFTFGTMGRRIFSQDPPRIEVIYPATLPWIEFYFFAVRGSGRFFTGIALSWHDTVFVAQKDVSWHDTVIVAQKDVSWGDTVIVAKGVGIVKEGHNHIKFICNAIDVTTSI